MLSCYFVRISTAPRSIRTDDLIGKDILWRKYNKNSITIGEDKFRALFSRNFCNGNVLEFNYVDGEPGGDAVLSSETGKEEFKFVNGQKEVRAERPFANVLDQFCGENRLVKPAESAVD